MFIAFVLVLLFILIGVLVGAYSVFSPFVQNIGDVVDFNSAYYGAIAGLERANLALKYKHPGFEGSGGFAGNISFGPPSDKILTPFGRLTVLTNGLSWQIHSRTSSIPGSGDGNVDYLLASSDSSNFNQLPYFTSEKVFLSLDNSASDQNAYTGSTAFSDFHGGYFTGQFRLPSKVTTAFSGFTLCADSANPNCDFNGDLISDDIVVNRGLKGNYIGVPFSILPNTSIFVYNGGIIDILQDTMIRESVINENSGMVYFGNTLNTSYNYNPILKYPNNSLTIHNVISSDPSIIKTKTFNQILNDTDLYTTGLEFSFGLVDLLRSTRGDIYPFLEYQLNFGAPVSNRFYTIEGASLVGNYNVRIIMKKSTNTDSSIGDFTIIF
ncbi:MAG: hypothetical protein WCO66_00485 [Candidatus Absconditabacteria bacterium]